MTMDIKKYEMLAQVIENSMTIEKKSAFICVFCVICVPQTIKLSFREAVAGASRNGDRHSAEDCQKFGANRSFSLQHLHPLQMTDDSFAK